MSIPTNFAPTPFHLDQVGACCPAPSGTQGNFGRNVLRGFGATQADVALQRQFHLTEKVGLRFRSEFFNIFNHPNFGNPNNNLTDPLFGHSTQTLASSLGSGGANGGFNPLYQIGGPRSIQLALKLPILSNEVVEGESKRSSDWQCHCTFNLD
jgi:hypothetical protein